METTEATEERAAVTDAALDAAAEGVEETPEEISEETEEESQEEAEEAQEEEEALPPEPEDNTVRSNLGRKVKYMEDSLSEMQRQNQELLTRMEAILGAKKDDEDDDEVITTRSDFRNFLAQELAKQKQQEILSQTQYEQGYLKTINKLGSEVDESEYGEIYDEMIKNHNIRYSDNASDDAERNWLKAERAVLRKKMAHPVKKNPLKGKQPKAPLGGSTGEVVIEKSKKMPKFDKAARDFMSKMGISEEKAAEILG